MAAASKASPAGKKSLTAFRLCAPKWVATALSGEGSRLAGGRWNSPGIPAVYLAESRALTALELLVHLPSPLSRARSFAMLEVEVPADLIFSPPSGFFPEDWNHEPPTNSSIAMGDEWLHSQRHLGYRLPSAVIADETILLLNPNHPEFSKVQILTQKPFSYDERLSGRTSL